MSDELIHDVEDSIKQERLNNLWKEYGAYIIAAAILAVLMTAAVSMWRNWNYKSNVADTTVLLQAMDSNDMAEALQSALPQMRPGHKAIGALTAAGLLLQDGENEKALLQYEKAANNAALPQDFRELAALQAARLEWADGEVAVDAESILSDLNAIWQREGSPWQAQARLQAAVIEAHANQDFERARTILAPLKDDRSLPPSLVENARQLDHLYSIKQAIAATDAMNTQNSKNETKDGKEGT